MNLTGITNVEGAMAMCKLLDIYVRRGPTYFWFSTVSELVYFVLQDEEVVLSQIKHAITKEMARRATRA